MRHAIRRGVGPEFPNGDPPQTMQTLILYTAYNLLCSTFVADPAGNGRPLVASPPAAAQIAAARARRAGSSRELIVRVTVYWKHGQGSDSWTQDGLSATGLPLVDRKSAAVDPRVIPYGSRIVLPEVGHDLVAMDTGAAVVDRSAARANGSNVPVVDVYFESREDAIRWARENPMFMRARIYRGDDEIRLPERRAG